MTARPSTPEELAGLVREAHDRHARLRLVAAGTWPGRAAAVARDAETLDLSAISGIVAYVPGDLTLTARAGTTVAEIDEATRAHGQWCPLLPWGGDDGTLGATFATATHGPCSSTLGAPRDIAIGIQFVDGTGALVRDGDGARSRLDAFARGPLAPLAMMEFEGRTLVRLGGNAAFVAASREVVRSVGAAVPCDPDVWTRLRASDPRPRAPLASSALADPLAQRVKRQFDPRHILNPGIMGEALS